MDTFDRLDAIDALMTDTADLGYADPVATWCHYSLLALYYGDLDMVSAALYWRAVALAEAVQP